MNKFTILTISILFSRILCSQTKMDAGFKMLETGKFDQAEMFFAQILRTDADNKTANLCYGRATGLNGKPLQANQLFQKMLLKYPNDYELKLNYAESFLWNKQYTEGATYYQTLINENPSSFAANLGLANSYSNLKQYPKALEYINRSLTIDPKNENAKISKKYILLGYGFELGQQNKYQQSYDMLAQNLSMFPKDEQTIWTICNVATTAKNFSYALGILDSLPTNEVNTLKINNQKALVAHLKNQNKKAEEIAIQNYTNLTSTTPSDLKQNILERYAQAQIWNHQFSKAESTIVGLKEYYPTLNWPLSLEATLGMYMSNFAKATNSYQKILAKDPQSFDGNLGIANAYAAQNLNIQAFQYGNQALSYYPTQLDIQSFLRKMEMKFSPEINTKTSYSKDKGNDEAFTYNVKFRLPLSTKFALNTTAIRRETRNQPASTFATLNNADLGFTYDFLPNLQYLASGRYISTLTNTGKSVQNIMANTRLFYKPNPFHNIELGFSQELQDFNTALIQKNIRMDNYLINYNMSTLKNIGFFGQYYYTHFSDLNTRNLLFTSLYYTFYPQPVIKAGINYQHIGFAQSKPTDYFSPLFFNLGEVFLQVVNQDNSSLRNQFLADFTIAVGKQFIENNGDQNSFRVHGEMGAKLNYQWIITAYAMHNNIASATAAGFTYTEGGIKLKYNFNHKIFKIK